MNTVPYAIQSNDTQVTRRSSSQAGSDVIEIPLERSLASETTALVDRGDAENIAQYAWRLHPDGYAARTAVLPGVRVPVYMHRQVLAAPQGVTVDHINGNRLDNRRDNLRFATASLNNANSRGRPRWSGFRGVY